MRVARALPRGRRGRGRRRGDAGRARPSRPSSRRQFHAFYRDAGSSTRPSRSAPRPASRSCARRSSRSPARSASWGSRRRSRCRSAPSGGVSSAGRVRARPGRSSGRAIRHAASGSGTPASLADPAAPPDRRAAAAPRAIATDPAAWARLELARVGRSVPGGAEHQRIRAVRAAQSREAVAAPARAASPGPGTAPSRRCLAQPEPRAGTRRACPGCAVQPRRVAPRARPRRAPPSPARCSPRTSPGGGPARWSRAAAVDAVHRCPAAAAPRCASRSHALRVREEQRVAQERRHAVRAAPAPPGPP